MILNGLCDAMAARMARPLTTRDQAAFPLLMLLWGRLRRTIARFARLAAHPAAAAPRPRKPATRGARKPSEQPRLPRGMGWLVGLVPEAACFGTQLQHFLTDPEMAALLGASPQMASLLRPLCRLLLVPQTDWPPRPIPAAKQPPPPPPESDPPPPDAIAQGPRPADQPTAPDRAPTPDAAGRSLIGTELNPA